MGNIYSTIGAGVPTGTIMPWPSEIPPRGWLICDGREVSRTTYARLFAVIGTRFGEGDGLTTFNLPDLRGRVPVGFHNSDEDFDHIGKRGGEKTHTLTVAEMPCHNHGGYTNISGEHNHGALTGNAGEHNHGGLTGSAGNHNHSGSVLSSGSHSHSASTSSAGSHQHASRTWRRSDPGSYYLTDCVDPYLYYDLKPPGLEPAGAHTHDVTIYSDGSHSHEIIINASDVHNHTILTADAHAHVISTGGSHAHSISEQGNEQAHNNLQPYIVLNFIIKT